MDDFKSFKTFLNENKNVSKDINDYSWDDLHGYTFSIYPFNITLITNATEDEVLPLWREFISDEPANPHHQDGNFDTFLIKHGFVAISSNKTRLRPLDRIANS